MISGKEKVSTRQLFVILAVSTLSPTIRIFPALCAKLGKQAGWLAPILAGVAFFTLCFIIAQLFKNEKAKNLGEVFDLVLGKFISKVLLLVYFFWCIILYFLYIRYYFERLLSSMFPDTNIQFLIISILILSFMMARERIEVFARFSEFSFIIFNLVIFAFLILLLPSVKLENVLPITYYDASGIAKAAYPVLGIWGYITFEYFFGELVTDRENTRKFTVQCSIFIMILTILILFFVIGALGYTVAQRMPLPFFNAVKTVTIVQFLDRLESLLLAVWVISDLITITFFAKVSLSITKSIFNLKETKYLAAPISIAGYIGSQFLSINRTELELFTEKLALPGNILLCFIVPPIILLAGKLRKKI